MSNIFEALKKSTDTIEMAGLIEAERREDDGRPFREPGLPFLVNVLPPDQSAHRQAATYQIGLNSGWAAPTSPGDLGLTNLPLSEDGRQADERYFDGRSIPAGGDPFSTFSESAELVLDPRVFPFLNDKQARVAEQYRILRTNILQHAAQPKVIAISSAISGDGKTLTAINTSGILAMKSDSRVLLIDADLRKCSVASMLGLTRRFGFAHVLRGSCTWEEAIIRLDEPSNLHVLTAGEVLNNPAELLDSEMCRSVMAALRKQFSFIIMDTTPTSAVTDFKLVLGVADGALIVVRPDHTERTSFLGSLDIDPPQKLLGTVINGYRDWFLWKTPETYSYYGGPSYRKGRFLSRFRRPAGL